MVLAQKQTDIKEIEQRTQIKAPASTVGEKQDSPCSSDWPGIRYVDQAGLEHTEILLCWSPKC